MSIHLKKWLVGCLLAALPVILLPLSAALGSDLDAWKTATVIAFVPLVGWLVACSEQGWPETRAGRMWAGYAFGLFAAWVVVGFAFERSAVHVENCTGQPLVVERGGEHWVTVPPGGSIRSRLPRGQHQLAVRSKDGKPLDELSVAVGRERAYVLNLLGAGTYRRGVAEYGSSPLTFDPPRGAGGSQRDLIKDAWIVADVDYVLENPPAKISERGSGSWASRSYLVRAR